MTRVFFTADLPLPLAGPLCGGRLSKEGRRLGLARRLLRLLALAEAEVLLEDEEERVRFPPVVHHERQRNVLKEGPICQIAHIMAGALGTQVI